MITACSWNQFDGEEHMKCQQLDAHKEISLFDNFECIDTWCPYIYLRIQNATSFIKCAGKKRVLRTANGIYITFLLFLHLHFILFCVSEMECRSPNQVRYIIRMQNTYENSANRKIFINVFIMFLFFTFTTSYI